MVVVTPNDVAAGWRPLTTAEITTTEGLLPEAFVILAAVVPGFDAKSPDLVKLVVSKMVRRVLKNPDGWRVAPGGSIDDYTEGGGTRDTSLSSGELYVSSEELKWFGVRTGGAFEIRLGGS